LGDSVCVFQFRLTMIGDNVRLGDDVMKRRGFLNLKRVCRWVVLEDDRYCWI